MKQKDLAGVCALAQKTRYAKMIPVAMEDLPLLEALLDAWPTPAATNRQIFLVLAKEWLAAHAENGGKNGNL